MFIFFTKDKNFIAGFFVYILITYSFYLFDAKDVYAHSPHDVISDIELSPSYDQDKSVFILVSDFLKKSTDDGYGWKELVNGLDYKNVLSSIAVSPSFDSDRTLFVSSDGDGIYRSDDGGTSWIKVNHGLDDLNIALLSISKNKGEPVVLAAGSESGLYRTQDYGRKWHNILSDSKITSIVFFRRVERNCVVAGDSLGNIHLSVDRGKSWRLLYQNANWGVITTIAISPNVDKDNTFFIGTEKNGVYKTLDFGKSFFPVNSNLPERANISSLSISPNYLYDQTIFASTWNEAIFYSKNGGKTWIKFTNGISKDKQADSVKYKSPHFGTIKISNNYEKDKTLFLAGFDGLFKSADGGFSWTQMETLPIKMIKGFSISSSNNANSTLGVVTYGGGAYISHDNGHKWNISNKGLWKTRLTDIAFSPTYENDNTIFSGSKNCILKSTNKGETWKRNFIVNKNWRTRLSSISKSVIRKLRLPSSFHDKIRDLMLKKSELFKPYPTVVVPTPSYDSDQTLYFGTRLDGIFKSLAGGRDNTAIWNGGNGKAIISMTLSPDFNSDQTIFASVRGKGIYKTNDKGHFWQLSNNGLPFLHKWNNSPDNHATTKKDILLAISPQFGLDSTVFAGCSEGLFKSENRGKNWSQIGGNAIGSDSYIKGIGISPNYMHDKTLVISVKGKGLFKSSDGGNQFAEIAPELIQKNYQIRWINFSKSYAQDRTIYSASNEELFESTDGGNKWRLIKRPVRYENHRDVIKYEGNWEILTGINYSASRASFSESPDAEVTLNFVGTGISWIGTTANDQGIAGIFLDGKYLGDVDQFDQKPKFMTTLYSVRGLASGPHTMTIKLSDDKNQLSRGNRIVIDAFDVYP